MTLSTCFKGLQDGSAVKNPPANAGGAGEVGSVPELRRSPGAGNGNPLLGKIFTWEIPWTEEPGGLQSMVLQRVGHYSATKRQQSLRSFVTAAMETDTTRQCQMHLRHWLKIN